MMLTRPRSAMLAAAVLAVVLTGCVAAPNPLTTPTHQPPQTPAAFQPTPTLPAPSPTQDVAAASDGSCQNMPLQVPVQAEEIEQLGGMSLLQPIDQGPRPYANGTAVLNDRGIPVAYSVAENDNFDSIAARFCVGGIWLFWVNFVRRDGDGQTLFVGDMLNLDAHTMTSVGDQNGIVYDNPLPPSFAIPPQR